LVHELSEAGEKPVRAAGPPVRFYAENELLLDEFGKRLCSIRWGGANGHPFVECKGAASPAVAALLRREFDHRPARLDAALDRSAPKLFERHIRITRKLAKAYGLRWEPRGDWVTPDAGRTIMLGSRSSQVVLRVYEKGMELAAKQGLELTDELRWLVRAEVEFKPQNQRARMRAATIEPEELWGLTAWLIGFANQAFSIKAIRVKVTERREANYERALRYMAQQYGAHLAQLLDDVGGDLEAFALAILQRSAPFDKKGIAGEGAP
jgi:DNA relaxase NicK